MLRVPPYQGSQLAQLVSYDVDAAAYFAKESTLSQTLSAGEKTAFNQFVLDLKAASLWTPLVSLNPFLGGTVTAFTVNARNPSATLGSGTGGLTASATGLLGDGSSGSLDTGLNTSSLSATSNAVCAYFRSVVDSTSFAVSCFDGLNHLAISPYNAGTAEFCDCFSGPGGDVSGSVANSQGLFTVSRTGANVVAGYRNTAQIGTNNSGVALPSGTLKLLRTDLVSSFYPGEIALFAAFSSGLTSGQVSTFQGIVQTFQTTLGRQV